MTEKTQRRTLCLRTLFCLVVVAIWGCTAPVFAASSSKYTAIFSSQEFKGSLKALKKWVRIVEKGRQQAESLATCGSGQDCPPAARSWQQMLKKGRTLTGQERLDWINRFFNRWPYRLDSETYGTSDYWATPREFLKNSGDCEDYAITKYWALRQLGISPDQIRIVVLLDEIRNIAHAVLAVYQKDDIVILDNMSNVIFSHQRYAHYRPYYSFNEEFRWAHVRLKPAR